MSERNINTIAIPKELFFSTLSDRYIKFLFMSSTDFHGYLGTQTPLLSLEVKRFNYTVEKVLEDWGYDFNAERKFELHPNNSPIFHLKRYSHMYDAGTLYKNRISNLAKKIEEEQEILSWMERHFSSDDNIIPLIRAVGPLSEALLLGDAKFCEEMRITIEHYKPFSPDLSAAFLLTGDFDTEERKTVAQQHRDFIKKAIKDSINGKDIKSRYIYCENSNGDYYDVFRNSNLHKALLMTDRELTQKEEGEIQYPTKAGWESWHSAIEIGLNFIERTKNTYESYKQKHEYIALSHALEQALGVPLKQQTTHKI